MAGLQMTNDTKQTTAYSVGDARENFAEIINRVAFGGERIVITRHGKPIAAIVSVPDAILAESVQQ